jgi:LysR family transcriptional regulator, glycine cleavage system transcriptional activator
MRRLPPLNALRIFEVAARAGSYAEAGHELGLTHGAVSRQVSLRGGFDVAIRRGSAEPGS